MENNSKKTIAYLKHEITVLDVSAENMSAILTRSVNAIRGQPMPLHRHSWHDLPDLIHEMKVDLLTAKLDLMMAKETIEKLKAELKTAP